MYERFVSSSRDFHDEKELLDLFTRSSTGLGQHLKVLEMRFLDPHESTVDELLKHTRNLTNLYLHYWLNYDQNGRGTCVDTERLSKSLRHVSRTLVELKVDYKFGVGLNQEYDWPISDLEHSPMNLRHLTALRTLSIPASILLGWRMDEAPEPGDLLPPSLVTLTFLRDSSYEYKTSMGSLQPFERMLATFAGSKRWMKWTPCLESICVRVGFWCESEEEQKGRSDTTKRILEDNGLTYIESREGLIEWS